ncbi:MAG: OadG family transporter subunit, partial [Bacillota bacterium]
GISIVFFLLMLLYLIMKAFEKLPSTSSKPETKIKSRKAMKKKSKSLDNEIQNSSEEAKNTIDNNIIAIITVIMAQKGINNNRISIRKVGGK